MRAEKKRGKLLVWACAAVAWCGCELLAGGDGNGADAGFSQGYVFVRSDEQSLHLVDAARPDDVLLLASGIRAKAPTFSPDAQTVVFAAGESVNSVIQSLPVNGQSGLSLVSGQMGLGNLRLPQFSPNGRVVAFAFDDGSTSSIGTVNSDGTNAQRVVAGGTIAYDMPVFSVDGQALYMAGGVTQTQLNQVYRLALNATAPQLIATLPTGMVRFYRRLAMSPDGRRIAADVVLSSGARRIVSLELNTGTWVQHTDYGVGVPNQDSYPAWKSATEIVFSSAANNAVQTYVVRTDEVKQAGALEIASAEEAWFGPLSL